MSRLRPALLGLCLLAAACGHPTGPAGEPMSALTGVDYTPVVLSVSRIVAPAVAEAGALVMATVEAVQPDGCTVLDRISSTVDDVALTVTFEAVGLENRNAYCIQAGYGLRSLSYRTQLVAFTPGRPGTYRLQASRGQATATLMVR